MGKPKGKGRPAGSGKPEPKPVTIRVYPENRSLYYTCYVWPSREAMHRHMRSEGRRPRRPSIGLVTGAYCARHRRYRVYDDGSMRISPQIGEVHFHRDQLDSETVTHEFTHAALGWAERVGCDPTGEGSEDYWNDPEERFCYALGEMVGQFTTRAYALGVY
jgi:hypothetical protein